MESRNDSRNSPAIVSRDLMECMQLSCDAIDVTSYVWQVRGNDVTLTSLELMALGPSVSVTYSEQYTTNSALRDETTKQCRAVSVDDLKDKSLLLQG